MASLAEHPRAWTPTRVQWGLIAALALGLIFRVLAITGRGHTGDITALRSWALGMAAFGPAGYYPAAGTSNYPPLLYLLWPLGTSFQGDALRTAIRALSIPFDLLLGVVIFGIAASAATRLSGRLGSAEGRRGVLGASLYLLNPVVIVSGPLWGQVDGIGALPMVAALWALAEDHVMSASVLAVLAGLIKPQFGVAVFIVVAVLVLDLRRPGGVRAAAQAGVAAILTFAVVMVPLGLGPSTYVRLLSITAARYPYYSLYGFNPWAILFGFGTKDHAAFWIGIALTGAAIVASLALLWRRRDLIGILGVAALIALALYFLPTRVHERYLFGAIAILAPLAAVAPRIRAPFVLLSGLFLVSIVYVLGNTPRPALQLPAWAHGDLSPAGILLLAGPMTIAGAWVAWSVLTLFRSRAATAESVANDEPTQPAPTAPDPIRA
jgi:hypothetical protein